MSAVEVRRVPSAEEINALPESVRHFIHDLETRCDPAGELRDLASLREQRDALANRIAAGSFKSKFITRDESAFKEGTRDPIFLLLVETAQLLDYDDDDRPEGWERDDDGDLFIRPEGCCTCHLNPPCSWCTDSRSPTFDEIVALRNDDIPICVETRVESVWLTRAECEAWIASHKYRFGSDQRARCYCVCANGELATALHDGTELSARARAKSTAAENGGGA